VAVPFEVSPHTSDVQTVVRKIKTYKDTSLKLALPDFYVANIVILCSEYRNKVTNLSKYCDRVSKGSSILPEKLIEGLLPFFLKLLLFYL
jgi:hypothetical protein